MVFFELKRRRWGWILFCLISVSLGLKGQSNNAVGSIPYSVHYLIDSTGNLSLSDAMGPEFQNRFDTQPMTSPNFGFDDHVYWFRIQLSDIPQNPLVIEVGQPSLDYISIFSKNEEGEWQEQKTGHAYNPQEKTLEGINYSQLLYASPQLDVIYLKVKASGAMSVPILIKSLSDYWNYKTLRTLALGVFFGLMLIMAVYNFMLFLFLKDTAYLLYVGATIFGLATSLVLNGYGYLYVWPNSPNFDSHIFLAVAGISMVFSSRFTSKFLNLKKYDPKMDKYLWGVAIAATLLAVLSIFYTTTQLLVYGRCLILIAFPSYIFIGIRNYRRGYKTALFYVVAWLPYILGLIVVTLRGAGLMPEYWVTTYGIEVGGSLEAVLLSFALAARIKGMRREIAEKELEKEQFRTRLLEEQKVLLEQKVEERTKELSEANATKDKFFSIIAHDLRSPMIALQGVGQKMVYFIKKEKQKKLLEMGTKIDQSIDQLNHLLNNLLNWAASQRGGVPHYPEQFNVQEVIAENVGLYLSLAESKNIKVNYTEEPILMYADKNTTTTIIRNLLSNAIKFSPDGGTVSLFATDLNEKIRIEIKDEGIGMDASKLSSLFDRNVRSTAGSHGEKGFGLGLKLTKEFIEKNNGEIEVRSSVGEGTSFCVSFPKEGKGEVIDFGVA